MTPEEARTRLCALGDHVRALVVAARASGLVMSTVEGRTAADTVFALDRVVDDVLVEWFEQHWPDVVLISEGLEAPRTIGRPSWTVIVDTIDGTRGLMYDKRAAWSLAAAAPVVGGARLADVIVAAMTEIPTTKQWASDQLSAVRGDGAVRATRLDVRTGRREPLAVRPSTAVDLAHSFASFAKFFPTGKSLTTAFEAQLWRELYGDDHGDLAIFDDQYLATGGQLHELLAGHDRVLGDLRPLAHEELGLASHISCHPYDCCTAMVLTEAGGVVTDPHGAPLDAPLDATTPVAWIGYANAPLAERLQPAVSRALRATFPRWFARH